VQFELFCAVRAAPLKATLWPASQQSRDATHACMVLACLLLATPRAGMPAPAAWEGLAGIPVQPRKPHAASGHLLSQGSDRVL